MKAGDAINDILREQERSQRSLALELGVSPQTISERLLGDGSVRVDTLVDMAHALDYKVMLLPKDAKASGFELNH